MSTFTVDVTPHPAILTVLGEIEFEIWQCVAELIDNCVDGFLAMERTGTPIPDPTVQVAFGRDTVKVKDNGPGMSLETLENALKAGWTSQERFGSLGLYGIGFNIATARLGSVTTIWTSQKGEDAWHVVQLDLRALRRGETYKIEGESRPKSDPSDSGTWIEITGIKSDWVPTLENPGALRAKVTDRLARIYGTMLRDNDPQPIKFSLRVNNRKVSAWEHCVWPSDWDVYRRDEGLVGPIREVDVTLGTKYVSRSTGEMYESIEGVDPDDLIEVPERIYGWLGVQRYADENEFGIDILRNGRKIEVGCKDVFDWEDANGNSAPEYPIDDPRQRGRLVGEIHLDHGYVHYTKHRFEREHYSWKQLLRAIRHDEPLTHRERQGFSGVNTSPLGVLFRVFRRNSPYRHSQPGGQTFWDVLVVKDNEKAKTWARDWRKGTPEYRDDVKWRAEIESADAPPAPPPGTPTPDDVTAGLDDATTTSTAADVTSVNDQSDTGGASDVGGFDDLDGFTGRADTRVDTTVTPATPSRTHLPSLDMHVTGIGVSGRAYDVEVYVLDVVPGSTSTPPWRSRATARGVYEIEVDRRNSVFNSTSLRVRDAVLAEVAYIVASEEASLGARDGATYAEILVALRARYAAMDSLDVNRLRMEIEEIRRRLADHLSRTLSEEAQRDALAFLSEDDMRRIELARARGSVGTPATDYLEVRHLAELLRRHPEYFFADGCFNRPWTPTTLAGNFVLLEEYRGRLTREVVVPLAELGEFMSALGSDAEEGPTYPAFIRACVNRVRAYSSDDGADV